MIFIYNLILWFLGFKGKNSGKESWELGVAFNLHQQNFLDYVSSLCCSSPIAATQLLTVSPLPPPCLLTSPKCAWLLSFLEYSKIFVASLLLQIISLLHILYNYLLIILLVCIKKPFLKESFSKSFSYITFSWNPI